MGKVAGVFKYAVREAFTVSARHQLDRPRSCFWGHHGFDVLCAMAPVFGAVRGVDLVGKRRVGILKQDMLVDTTSLDVALASRPSAAVPGSGVPESRSDIEIIAATDDPNCYRFSQCAVWPEGRNVQFFCSTDLIELIVRPRRHWRSLCFFYSRLFGP